MNKINIIGLGPGNIDLLTLKAFEMIKDDNPKFLRTKHHPTVEYFEEENIEYKSFDYLYNEKDDFDKVYNSIVDELIARAEEYKEINYFVPGNPMIAEKTVKILLEKEDIDIELVSGMSFIEPMLELLEKDPIDGLKIIDGANFRPTLIDINSNIIITQTYNRRILIDLKLFISEIYGDEYDISVVHNAGIPGLEKVENIPVYKLDQIEEVGHMTSIYLPKVKDRDRQLFDFNNLLDIIKVLRGEDGCPWDIEQTHESLRGHIIEEAYELVNAIENENVDNIVEELGDLLFLIALNGVIGEESGEFNIIDITSNLTKKLIYRHPHVFSTNKVVKTEEVLYNWDRMKDSQRNLDTLNDKILDITNNLPLLIKSYKTQEVAAREGFDWDDIEGPMEKIVEEYEEISDAIRNDLGKEKIEEEIGDLLFSVVNLARFADINPEIALNKANNKFIDRLKIVEEKSFELGKDLNDMNMQELDELWNLAKK